MGEQMKPRFLIIMATYNGELYLRGQIESILAQEDVEVTLRINDDCSTDGTIAIAKEYERKCANVEVCENGETLGVGLNFMQGFYDGSYAGYDYYAYSDQDDLWYPEKLAHAYEKLVSYKDEPTLWFCDVMNVDERGDKLGLEMSAYRECEKYIGTPLLCNYVNGCAQVFNAKMVELLSSYKRQRFDRLHDAWTMLIARYCGRVIADFDYVGQKRRIHASNVVGQSGNLVRGLADVPEVMRRLAKSPIHSASQMAQDLLDGYGEYMGPKANELVGRFASYGSSFGSRLRMAINGDFWLPTIQQRLAMRTKIILGWY